MRSDVIIVATIILSAGLFVINLVVAIDSSSRAVLAQAIYTVTDLIGSGLLLVGLHSSRRPPDRDHPFGFGKERFFWAFVSTLVTFTIAGIVALTTGIAQVVSPAKVSDLGAALAVVGGTMLVSIAGILVTLRELRHSQQTIQYLLESAHQGLKTIFYQDLVSILGTAVAFGGIAVVYRTGNDAFDGLAAAIVGVLLIATGVVLSAESRDLLVGRAVPPSVARTILDLVETDARVRKVRGLQSMLLGPEDVLLTLRVNFQDGLTTDQIESAIDHVSLSVRTAFPAIRHMIIEPES